MCWTGGQDATPQPDGHGGKALTQALELQEGSHHDFVLVLDAEDAGDPPDPDRAWQATAATWADRVPAFEETVAPRDARHAYTVMSGMTSEGGGMVAAATTSLPERAEQNRNYDYRYVWIRDQCYAGQAVAKAGPHPLMDDAVRFVTDRLLGRRLRSSSPPTRSAGGPRARAAPARPARLPGWLRHRRQLGHPAVSTRRPRRGAAAVRPPPAATITSTPTAGAPPRWPPPRSNSAGRSRTPTPASGSSIPTHGPTAA